MTVRLLQRLRDPTAWTSVSQLAKTVLAAVIAWVLAVRVLHVAQAFMAPWAALLTVQATVFGTLKRGLLRLQRRRRDAALAPGRHRRRRRGRPARQPDRLAAAARP